MDMTLNDIAQLLADEGLLARTENLVAAGADSGNTVITGADCDSRFAGPNHLFICKGAAFREAYLDGALAAGCVAYLCDEARADALVANHPGVPALVASDLRRAMAKVCAPAWGHPDRRLDVCGITGTKGKSTVAYMLRAILDAGAPTPRAAILGSIDTFDGIENAESVNTTPEPPDLWRHLSNAVAAGLPHMVMEVSSQALKYDRVLGLGIDVACFLNIGRDHISPAEHPDFEDYFASKLRIFAQSRVAVVNLDSDEAARVLEAAAACQRLVTFSATAANGVATVDGAKKDVDIWASDIEPLGTGIRFVAHTPAWTGEVLVSMPGLFNVDNALAAIAMCCELGVEQDQIVAGLAHVRVPGRMELFATDDPRVTGIVDYAHNKLSYQRFFASISKEFAGRKIIAVFGAPGGKAHERRQELPQEAARWADHLIYTEEDPAHDPVEQICAQMAAATPAGQSFEVITDRPAAIERAVQLAFDLVHGDAAASDLATGDAAATGVVVCLLAKGEETRQHVGDRFLPCETDATIFQRAAAAEYLRHDNSSAEQATHNL